MLRRSFLQASLSTIAAAATLTQTSGEKLAAAARLQIGVTTSYDPRYISLTYPNGDVPRNTGVCADVIVRAARDALALDLQKLIHEDILAHFSAYPHIPGMRRADSNIDHRRVLNLEAFWARNKGHLWSPTGPTAGDAFPAPFAVGDFVTWMLDARLPHVAIVSSTGPTTSVIHNIGRGTEETELAAFHPHRAKGHFRWPAAA